MVPKRSASPARRFALTTFVALVALADETLNGSAGLACEFNGPASITLHTSDEFKVFAKQALFEDKGG